MVKKVKRKGILMGNQAKETIGINPGQ